MATSHFSVTILGSNSALPANNRYPSAQLLQCENQHYLIDCGEGTQMQFRRYRLKMQRIKTVFISHLHGDHYFGLLGLMNTMHLLGRTAELTIVAPAVLEQIIALQMDAGGGKFQYPVRYVSTDHITDGAYEIYADNHITVTAFPLKHRIACTGFVFRQKPKERSFIAQAGERVGVTLKDIPYIKAGGDFVQADGTVVSNATLTKDPPAPKSYAYCTDTLPLATTAAHVAGVDCLYHEATFMQEDIARANKTFHSSAAAAAKVALEAGVGKLLLGHFSARYDALEPLLDEARAVFPNAELALEGMNVRC